MGVILNSNLLFNRQRCFLMEYLNLGKILLPVSNPNAHASCGWKVSKVSSFFSPATTIYFHKTCDSNNLNFLISRQDVVYGCRG